MYDDSKNEFVTPSFALEIEHSLVSVSKWESFFEKPFLSNEEKTEEQTLWYVKAMTLTPDVPQEIYSNLTVENVQAINDYVASKQSATWFREDQAAARSGKVITSELIYFWMIHHRIPVQFESWHLNRLITLIRVCNEENKPPSKNKMSKADSAERRRALNAARREKLGTSG